MKTPSFFQIGQCWTSEGEPELGLGFVRALDEMSVAIEYPANTQGRMYRKKTAPLRRLEFRVGEKVLAKTGKSMLIERVETRDHLNWYIGPGGAELCESDLSPHLPLQRPIERFLSGKWDPLSAFVLRRKSAEVGHRHQRSPARGMIGPRAALLPHQLYVTSEISKRGLPRALLADEVGLGKTIEAGWILHRLLLTGRMKRVLIIVPEALMNQWFVELLRRFNLSFWVPDSQSEADVEAEDLETEDRVILSLESLVKMRADGILTDQKWDLVIVDEAHRIEWSEEGASREYEILAELAAKSPGLLLLTATPEQLGLVGHFSRLQLIDPHRFSSFRKFEQEHDKYRLIVKISEKLTSSKKITPSDSKSIHALLDGKIPDAVFQDLE
ncbi:MAG: DEAD/DEAH box helicase family protein, partial [Cryobacterium sp.]|nr:DEAD/DEAH box helicase family protein [Oligoflexia bacterium]